MTVGQKEKKEAGCNSRNHAETETRSCVFHCLSTSWDPGKKSLNHPGPHFLIFQMGMISPCYYMVVGRFGGKCQSGLKIM